MEKVSHAGIVAKVGSDEVWVTIRSTSACSNCQTRSSCTLAECHLKAVQVKTSRASAYHLGQRVIVSMDNRLGWLAVFFGYGLPLALVLVTLLIGLHFFDDESLAAITSLAVLVSYYVTLAFLRKKLAQLYHFEISPE